MRWAAPRSTRAAVSYFPNRLAEGNPTHSPAAEDAFVSVAEKVDGGKIRARSESFSDHFSQATQFWNSMSDWEREHIADAFAFETQPGRNEDVRFAVINELLVNIAKPLAEAVSAQTGHTCRARGHSQEPDSLGADAIRSAATGGQRPCVARAQPG